MVIDIGRQISTWRQTRGLTQNQLAEKASISRSYLAGVETGRYNPSVDTLQGLAAALNIPISSLLETDQKEQTPAIHESLSDPVTAELLKMVREASEEERRDMLDLLRIVQKRREGK